MNNNKSLLQFCGRVLLTVSIVSGATLDGNGKIFDITHKISSESPIFDSKKGLGRLVTSFGWFQALKHGSRENASKFELGTHTGTHVDAPSHYSQQYYEEGFDVTTLSLQTLNGKIGFISPALVVDVSRNHNITAEVMKSLNIPRGVHRVLFKTLITDRRLMHKTEFASDFTGFKKDGAEWLVDNTDIKLVGKEIVPVEGLNLEGIEPGKYTVHCLPLRMVGADGVPARQYPSPQTTKPSVPIDMVSMARPKVQLSLALLLALVAMAVATPPGIANNPSRARCNIKKYKYCYNLEHVCPKFCPGGQCTVNCVSCKPVCLDGTYAPPDGGDKTSTPPSPSSQYENPPSSPTPTYPTPSPPPPSPETTYPPTESQNPPPSPPSQSANPPSSPTQTYPPPPPSPPTQSQSPPPYTPPKTVKCKNKNYTKCYDMKHVCPSSCAGDCEVDCVTCKPVCNCDRPGAVCQDPRFIGGDGTTFYFHGKKDQDFCLVSDPNLHINGHFIGKRNADMKRDFTWVQSIAILFDNHQLFAGALKTSTWDDSIDRLSLTFDGQPVNLPEREGAKWQSADIPTVSITRASDTNHVIVEAEGKFKITAKVVPITEEDSRIHNYGITKEDCFAHLDLGFKFYSLSDQVNGVLGQTYKPGYVSHLNIGAKMPVMGGGRDFHSSNLFAPDCAVARFTGISEDHSFKASKMAAQLWLWQWH
ncbi:hypothetical protein V6N13_106130 [Hibiscus sabdariffa]|uniref:Uncharacterized protein n=1 Tax=Hibiscus sabdariffa TaxID=183260 RepID=A0ABR2EZU3_9ROSI